MGEGRDNFQDVRLERKSLNAFTEELKDLCGLSSAASGSCFSFLHATGCNFCREAAASHHHTDGSFCCNK